MDVKALLLVAGHDSARIADVPFAMLDVLGEPVLQRVVQRMEKLGVSNTVVVSDTEITKSPTLKSALRPDVIWKYAATDFWKVAEQQFNDFAQQGAEIIVLAEVGAYLEIDFEDLIQFHLDRAARITQVCDDGGEPLGIFVASASRRNDAAVLLRNKLVRGRNALDQYIYRGYINRLRSVEDFRALALDAFAGDNSIKPAGTEMKPGVWVAEGAKIHPAARVLAPAFIGAKARVRASAVVTRGASIEGYSEVDCGTVIENSSILPFTYVGAGLDVSRSVVGFQHIANIPRQVTVEVGDDRLVKSASSSATASTIGQAVDLVTYLPRLLFKGFSGKTVQPAPSIPDAVTSTSSAISVPTEVAPGAAGTFNGEFIPVTQGELGSFGKTVRNYGDE